MAEKTQTKEPKSLREALESKVTAQAYKEIVSAFHSRLGKSESTIRNWLRDPSHIPASSMKIVLEILEPHGLTFSDII